MWAVFQDDFGWDLEFVIFPSETVQSCSRRRYSRSRTRSHKADKDKGKKHKEKLVRAEELKPLVHRARHTLAQPLFLVRVLNPIIQSS